MPLSLSERNFDSYSAMAAKICIVRRFAYGLSHATKSIELSSSRAVTDTFLESRSQRAKTSVAPDRLACASALTSSGRFLSVSRRPVAASW
jgi:hypothetical protein